MSTARTVEEIANGALVKLGEGAPFITDLNADTSKSGKICKERLASCRQAFLRKHHWNFAIRRKRLTPTYKTITNVAAGAGSKIRITIAAHGWATGDRVTIVEVAGVTSANGSRYITVIDANNFDLDDSLFSGTYTASGRATLAPAFDYTYQITLPTDCLKVVQVNENDEKFRVEDGMLLLDDSTANIKYVYDNTTYSKWDSAAYECFQIYLAWDICEAVTRSTEKQEGLLKALKDELKKCKNIDANEDIPDKLRDDWIIEQRFSQNRGFVRDPMT
jgi:hypothetical protein